MKDRLEQLTSLWESLLNKIKYRNQDTEWLMDYANRIKADIDELKGKING